MNDWGYAQQDPAEQFARLHVFTMKKIQDGSEIEFTLTVKKLVTPRDGAMQLFAQADKQTNQRLTRYTFCGWGRSLLAALEECLQEIKRFPYEEQAEASHC